VPTSIELTSEPLFKVQRRIARRADELARKIGQHSQHSIVPWEIAEREIWADLAEQAGAARLAG
jgi:hypothetical protein